MDPALQSIIDAAKATGNVILPAIKALLNLMATAFEIIAKFIRTAMGSF